MKKNMQNTKKMFTLRLESSENIPILFQGANLNFSNQNDLRNPKMGSKQSQNSFLKKSLLRSDDN